MRADRRSFRRAVAASVVIHAVLAAVLVLVGRWSASRPLPARPPGIDTRTTGEPRIELRFADEPVIEIVAEPRGADAPRSPEAPAPQPSPATGSRPEVARVPAPLPPEVLALVRKPRPVGGEVVEVALTPTPLNPAPPAPSPSPAAVRPAAHISPNPGPSPTPPLHGALSPGQTIVYVLDASGSMGEWGKFDRARAALIATLRAQPPSVRFQVVVYAGTADFPLPAPVGGCATATADNVDRMALALETRTPAGRSDHLAGLRPALTPRPDFVLILTDAGDLPAAKFRSLVAQHGRPVRVCVAKVGAEVIAPYQELK